jgi:hypothetical protein
MIRRRITTFEFVMNSEEFEVLNIMCDREQYAYGYYTNAMDEIIVRMTEDVLNQIERTLEIYMNDFDFDYENERREITTEEFEFNESVKELYESITDEDNEEEWSILQ